MFVRIFYYSYIKKHTHTYTHTYKPNKISVLCKKSVVFLCDHLRDFGKYDKKLHCFVIIKNRLWFCSTPLLPFQKFKSLLFCIYILVVLNTCVSFFLEIFYVDYIHYIHSYIYTDITMYEHTMPNDLSSDCGFYVFTLSLPISLYVCVCMRLYLNVWSFVAYGFILSHKIRKKK